jgi:hypothetical protein
MGSATPVPRLPEVVTDCIDSLWSPDQPHDSSSGSFQGGGFNLYSPLLLLYR